MPRPIKLSNVIKTLKKNGFYLVSQKGSYAKFRKKVADKHTVIVKMSKKEIPHGTFQAIILQSDLKEKDFRDKKKLK